jgi:hypothetical protein
MKIGTIKAIFVLLFLTVSLNTLAQLGESNYDYRIKSQLENLGIKFQITDTGNFKLIFDMGKGRTQMVIINSNTYEYGGMEIREITSIAAIVDSKNEFNQSNLLSLLELNETYKLGAWQINGGTSPYILQYALRISANSTQSVLNDLIRLAARIADEMEQKLTNEDEY